MPYKRFTLGAWTFSIPQFSRFFGEYDLFNTNSPMRSLSHPVAEHSGSCWIGIGKRACRQEGFFGWREIALAHVK